MHSSEDKLREEARVRTKNGNVEENSWLVSTLTFSSWHVVSLCPANAGDSTLRLCFFSRRLIKKCSNE